MTTTEAGRLFSKVEQTLTVIRASVHESQLKALLLLQVHRQHTPSVTDVIDRFAERQHDGYNFCYEPMKLL